LKLNGVDVYITHKMITNDMLALLKYAIKTYLGGASMQNILAWIFRSVPCIPSKMWHLFLRSPDFVRSKCPYGHGTPLRTLEGCMRGVNHITAKIIENADFWGRIALLFLGGTFVMALCMGCLSTNDRRVPRWSRAYIVACILSIYLTSIVGDVLIMNMALNGDEDADIEVANTLHGISLFFAILAYASVLTKNKSPGELRSRVQKLATSLQCTNETVLNMERKIEVLEEYWKIMEEHAAAAAHHTVSSSSSRMDRRNPRRNPKP